MIDTTKTIREVHYNGTAIPLLGGVDNPVVVTSDAEMEACLNDDRYLGMYVKFSGESENYLNGQVYKIAQEGEVSKFYQLPTLDNEGTAADLAKGKQLISSGGKLITGTANLTDNLLRVIDKSVTKITAEDLQDVTNIGEYLFYKCEGLTDVTLSGNITNIGNNAFSNCSNLQNIHITDSVTNIGSYAFYNCTKLTNIIIPDNVTNIGSSIFSGCSGLTKVTIGKGITNISSNAFQSCSNLTSVTIPDNVTNIDYRAFYNCTGLTSVMIGNGVTNIGGSAFNNCSKLESVVIPSTVTNIGSDAFYSCRKIKKIYITDVTAWCNISGLSASSLTFYGGSEGGSDKELYLNNELVTSLVIPDGVTLIPSSAFANFYKLTSVVIPDSVTSIEERAFRRSGLTNVTIPNGVTNIGRYAFDSCKHLMEVIIPNSVTSIDQGAFGYCSILNNITLLPTTPPTLGSGVFTSISSSAVITVPKGTLDAYKTATNWSAYADKMVEASN